MASTDPPFRPLVVQPQNGNTALGSGRFTAMAAVPGTLNRSAHSSRRFGAAALQNIAPDERVFTSLLPVMGPVLISSCGWSVVPSNDLVLPRAGGLSVEELAQWQLALAFQAHTAQRRAPSLFQEAGERLAALLLAEGYTALADAANTPALLAALRLVSAALALTTSALFSHPGMVAPVSGARPRLAENLMLLQSGKVGMADAEPWGPSFWPYAWHPALHSRWDSEDETFFRTLHRESGAAYPWQDPRLFERIQVQAREHQRQVTQTLQYRAEQTAQANRLESGRRQAGEAAVSGTTRARSDIQLSLQDAAEAIRAVVMGTGHPKSSVAAPVQAWLSAWGELDTLLPEVRHLRSALRLNLDPRDAERLGVRLAAYDPAPTPGAPYGQIIVNVMNAIRAGGGDLSRMLCRLAVSAALGQPARGQGLEAVLWSAACAMINEHWFDELGLPPLTDNLDPQPTRDTELEKLGSAEAIYAELLKRQVRSRTLSGSRGAGLSDFISPEENAASGMSEEEEQGLRNRLARGLEEAALLRLAGKDGHGGLIRELRAAAAEPVAWRPALLEWATPHYPRPQRHARWDRLARRTPTDPRMALPSFRGEDRSGVTLAVIADTSGSMDDETLQEGLGAIEQTCAVLEVGRIRLISCDTLSTDHGPINPWSLRQAVRLSGGGGTELQDAVELLNSLAAGRGDPRFPPLPITTPVLILTDGFLWERVDVKYGRPHAWLLPKGGRLPFHTTAPVFTIRKR